MLAVITDDLTGASEIGGIALSKGYRTVIETQSVRRPDADVLVIASDMRSLDPENAAKKSALLTEQLMALEPEMIFKKVDSVLRGNIGPELEAQMRVEDKARALLVPANPSRQRTISDGIYYVDSVPIAESGFACNRNNSVATSRVVDILINSGTSTAFCISTDDELNGAGVHIGNTQNLDDLAAWAGRVDNKLVPAGAADFFTAILDARRPPNGDGIGVDEPVAGRRALYVCGSSFPSSRHAVSEARRHGFAIVDMPDEIYFSNELDTGLLACWGRRVSAAFDSNQNVIITALQSPRDSGLSGQKITQAMAIVTKQVFEDGAIDDLMIEGGATAQAVMAALDIDSLHPTQSLAPGVTRMRVDDYPRLHVTMKPGSYPWPASIWTFNS